MSSENQLLISRTSTSKVRVELGGITGKLPCSPYARSDGIINLNFSPTFISIKPSSKPGMRLPTPIVKLAGLSLFTEESKIVLYGSVMFHFYGKRLILSFLYFEGVEFSNNRKAFTKD